MLLGFFLPMGHLTARGGTSLLGAHRFFIYDECHGLFTNTDAPFPALTGARLVSRVRVLESRNESTSVLSQSK